MENVIYGGAIDAPDLRDYEASHVLGEASAVIPEEFSLDLVEGNQAADPSTKVACTLFTAYHVCKIANMIEHGSLEPDFKRGWELQKKFGTYNSNGDSVQTALKSILKNGFITNEGKVYPIQGYAKIEKDRIKYWLSRGYAIVTSSLVTKNNSNFKKAEKTGIWGGADGVKVTGHAFCLTGYNANHYKASNSYGKEWGFFKDGTFLIRNADLHLLGTCYVVYDKKDGADIFKDVTTLSPMANAIFEMKNRKIVNGYADNSFKPNSPVTRAEMCQIIWNLMEQGYITKKPNG